MWTSFNDCHSGGGTKEKFEICFIEAPQELAELIFYNKFGHSPHRVTCTCCGPDYSVDDCLDDDGTPLTLEQATNYYRLRFPFDDDSNETMDLDIWEAFEEHLVIRKSDILLEDCFGTVPEQGYVWKG